MFRVMISSVWPTARMIMIVEFSRRSLTPCEFRNSGLAM